MIDTPSHCKTDPTTGAALDTYEGILAAFQVPDLVRALDLGGENHARVLRHRRRIPVRYWPDIVTLASELGVAVGPENLGRAELSFQVSQRRKSSAQSSALPAELGAA